MYYEICPIRKSNSYKKMIKATRGHRVISNTLNHKFKQEFPQKALFIWSWSNGLFVDCKRCRFNNIRFSKKS